MGARWKFPKLGKTRCKNLNNEKFLWRLLFILLLFETAIRRASGNDRHGAGDRIEKSENVFLDNVRSFNLSKVALRRRQERWHVEVSPPQDAIPVSSNSSHRLSSLLALHRPYYPRHHLHLIRRSRIGEAQVCKQKKRHQSSAGSFLCYFSSKLNEIINLKANS